MTRLEEIDAEIRREHFEPRATSEETGLTTAEPVRAEDESDGYWHARLLTHQICGMHYRTPQFNGHLLARHINEQNRVAYKPYVANKYAFRFETTDGIVTFDVSDEIDPKEFRERFGLSG